MQAIIKAVFFSCMIIGGNSFADSPAMPTPKVTVSNSGEYYFKMIPNNYSYENSKYIEDTKAFGKAYRLNDNGESEELWSVSDWYAFNVFISDDGKYLVRIGNWPDGHEPDNDDLGVAFYYLGSEIKKYSTQDLIEDKSYVQSTVSHYFWLDNDKSYPRLDWYSHIFELKTIEGKVIRFNIATGDVVENPISPISIKPSN